MKHRCFPPLSFSLIALHFNLKRLNVRYFPRITFKLDRSCTEKAGSCLSRRLWSLNNIDCVTIHCFLIYKKINSQLVSIVEFNIFLKKV